MPNDHNYPGSDETNCLAPVARPFGALPEWAFQEACLSCGDCAAVCPQTLIALDEQRRPVLTNARSCGRCGLCADVCMNGAIEFTPDTRRGLVKTKDAEANKG